MDRETARQEIRQNWRTLIKGMTTEAKRKANGEITWICPKCGNGSGQSGDGLTFNPKSRDGNGLKCFGCGFSGDIIDLYRQINGVDYNTALFLLAEQLNLTIDPYRPKNGAAEGRRSDFGSSSSIKTQPAEKTQLGGVQRPQEPTPDFMEYYRICRERINDPAAVNYLKSRGISLATAAAYWVGYDPAADPAESGHPTPRIIIPTTRSHYIGRAIRSDIAPQYQKLNPKGSSPSIFNGGVLNSHDVQEVFVVEGVFDALSIIESGAAAISLNSATNGKILIEQLERERTNATLILVFDNDSNPETRKRIKQNERELLAGLRRLNISCSVADLCGQYKDANERLQKDRAGLIDAIQAARRQIAPKPDNTAFYINHLMKDEISSFKDDIETGYINLDEKSGGLYAGLYVVAAISSLGKTTFVHQMGDQIAAAGNDVLYFSLEQSRLEMVSKSLARITTQNNHETAVTSLSIRRGYFPRQVIDAADEYKESIGDRMSIIEGNFACNISFIGDYIRRYIARNGVKPVVIVDYLQILQPEERNGRQQTAKETVDSTVTELKRLSREHGLTVIAICSVNRANYLTPIDFESLKESGNIEYTADVIWGLQLHCLESDPIFEKVNDIKKKRERIQEEKAKNPRSIDLICLKNRYGVSNYRCSFNYYPANDLFEPVSEYIPVGSKKREKGRTI